MINYAGSISEKVLSTKPVSASAESLIASKKLSLNWSCRVKAKVWVCENGAVVCNDSYTSNGNPVRVFRGYKSQFDYDSGKLFCEAKNLRTCQLNMELI